MKTKKLSKKLTLNKNTIANLINTDMQKVHGGAGVTIGPTDCCTIHPECPNTIDFPCDTLDVLCS